MRRRSVQVAGRMKSAGPEHSPAVIRYRRPFFGHDSTRFARPSSGFAVLPVHRAAILNKPDAATDVGALTDRPSEIGQSSRARLSRGHIPRARQGLPASAYGESLCVAMLIAGSPGWVRAGSA